MFLLWLICLLFHCCTLFSFWCGALCSMIALLCFNLWRYFKILFSMAANWISKRKGVEVPLFLLFFGTEGDDDRKHTPALVPDVIFCSIALTIDTWFLQKIPKDRKNLMHLFFVVSFLPHEKVLLDLTTWVLFPRLILDPYQVLFCFFLPFGRTLCRSLLRYREIALVPPSLTTNHNSRWVIYFCLVCSLFANGLWEILSTCILRFIKSWRKQILCDLCVFE